MTPSPQLDDGFTRIANELFDAILGARFTARQISVVMAIIRKTYGYNKKEDDMSASQIGALCAMNRTHVTETLNQLARMNVICKRPGVHGSVLSIQKNYSKWIGDPAAGSEKTGTAPARTSDVHYTYCVTHSITGEFYIGVRSCKCHPNQDRYVGSGNWIATIDKAMLRKEILQSFETRSEAEQHEVQSIRAAMGNTLLRNVTFYEPAGRTESVQGGQILSIATSRTDSVQGVQENDFTRTDSVQVDRTDSVHTKDNLTKDKQKKDSLPEILFDQWIESARTAGQKPIPEDHAVFKYADKVDLPIDFIRLCWLEFKTTFSGNKKKKYADWAQAFSNYVRKNYFRLWFEKDGAWQLTTAGIQLQKEMRDTK